MCTFGMGIPHREICKFLQGKLNLHARAVTIIITISSFFFFNSAFQCAKYKVFPFPTKTGLAEGNDYWKTSCRLKWGIIRFEMQWEVLEGGRQEVVMPWASFMWTYKAPSDSLYPEEKWMNSWKGKKKRSLVIKFSFFWGLCLHNLNCNKN